MYTVLLNCCTQRSFLLQIFCAPLRDCKAVTLIRKLSCRGYLFVTQISLLTWGIGWGKCGLPRRDIADMNPLESDNKLVTYHPWFACPLLDLQTVHALGWGMGVPPWCHLTICTLTSLLLWGLWAGFAREHVLSRWNPPSGAVEMAAVTSVPVLLSKMRCMSFFTVKTCLCALSEKSTRSFSSLSADPFLWRPLSHALPGQTVFDFLSQRHNKLCHFIHYGLIFDWRRPATNQSA